MDRDRLVWACIADADTPRVSWRPWRLEEALTLVTGAPGEVGDAARRWLHPTPLGHRAAGLEQVLADLCRSGRLVNSTRLRCLVVDPWRRTEETARIRELATASRESIAAVASRLDELEARSVPAGTASRQRPSTG